jgi:hypothetical protein
MCQGVAEELSNRSEPCQVRKVASLSAQALIGAMYLQMHWLMAAGNDLTRCWSCGHLISLARPHPEAESADGTRDSATTRAAKRTTEARESNSYCQRSHPYDSIGTYGVLCDER